MGIGGAQSRQLLPEEAAFQSIGSCWSRAMKVVAVLRGKVGCQEKLPLWAWEALWRVTLAVQVTTSPCTMSPCSPSSWKPTSASFTVGTEARAVATSCASELDSPAQMQTDPDL